VIFAEIAQREAVQVPLVRRIAERTEVRVMRGDDEDVAAWLEQSMEFLDGPDYVRDVLDEMDGADFTKGTVAKRKREVVKIGDNVGIRVRIPIDPNCTWIFVDAATYVEYPARGIMRP
jgi:hypothetical protein